MKKNILIQILAFKMILASSVFSWASVETQKIDFTHKIKTARSDERNLLKAFQAELQSEAPHTLEQEEVIEFLNSEIRWKAPEHNAKNSNF